MGNLWTLFSFHNLWRNSLLISVQCLKACHLLLSVKKCFKQTERISLVVLDSTKLGWQCFQTLPIFNWLEYKSFIFSFFIYYFKAPKQNHFKGEECNLFIVFIYCVLSKSIFDVLEKCKLWAFSKHCLLKRSCQLLIQPVAWVWGRTIWLSKCFGNLFGFFAIQKCHISPSFWQFNAYNYWRLHFWLIPIGRWLFSNPLKKVCWKTHHFASSGGL